MDFNVVAQLISQFGFPVVCSGVLFWYILQKDKTYTEQLDEIRKSHHDEVSELKETIANNTVAMQKLCDKLEMMYK